LLYLQLPSERSSHVSQTTYLCTEAAYWVIPAGDVFSVEVITPWDYPTTVSPFATAAGAKAWIAEHQTQRLSPRANPSSPNMRGIIGHERDQLQPEQGQQQLSPK
jgi:hypothetical protein